MKKSLALTSAVLLVLSFAAAAKNAYLTKFKQTYPSAKIKSCSICHTDADEGSLNSYGDDFNSAGNNFKAVERKDSDGDGKLNIAEIKGGTNPGDRSSFSSYEF